MWYRWFRKFDAFSWLRAKNERHYVVYIYKFISSQSKKWCLCIITFYKIPYSYFFMRFISRGVLTTEFLLYGNVIENLLKNLSILQSFAFLNGALSNKVLLKSWPSKSKGSIMCLLLSKNNLNTWSVNIGITMSSLHKSVFSTSQSFLSELKVFITTPLKLI
jgi:hypothetical protein